MNGTTNPLRVIVGTAGHVDHGKTALVKALTGIDTDRLPEEKRRGITLEAGYAHLQLPGIGIAGVVDVPGHERFLRAMVGAAFGVDVAVLCVAADEGPMPQTAEHLDVLRLLGVTSGVVALTKSDLLAALGPDHRELLLLELRDLFAGTFLEKAPIVECSARTGQGLRELVEAIAKAVKDRIDAPRSEVGPLFLPLDRAFAVKGFGTVVTGTLFSGSLGAGDEVDLVGSGARVRGARVRGVQVHGAGVDRARAGQRTAANIANVDVGHAPRGAALVPAGTLDATGGAQILDVELELLPWAARPLKDRARLLAHIGTAQAQATVALIDRKELLPGERALAQLRLGTKVAALSGLRFLVRGELGKAGDGAQPAGRFTAAARAHASTLGGGRILAVGSRKRRKRESDVRALSALAGDDALAQAEALLLEAGHLGSSPQRLAAQGAFTFKAAGAALERLSQLGRAVLLDRESRLYVHAGLLAKLERKVLARLEEHAALGDVDPSIVKEELRQRSGAPPARLFARALAHLAEAGELRTDAERVRPTSAPAPLGGPDASAQEKLAGILDGAGLSPPRTDELPALIGESPHRTAALLKTLATAGRASKVSEELWFGSQPLRDLRGKLLAHLSAHGSIDAQGFKELTGQSRKFTIPLAEWFDKERVTLRV
ncbi:MAG TPA: selenocysteine-specific translation elongation factor, partial [Myxococcales bacterium]|nr:selenocysteine-specific translation elongation factor [Myxococcales bacterium]